MIAHPGHELRVHGWLERLQPRVFVLTDGSGHSSRSRLDSTTRVLDRAGARAGWVYGRLTDREVYQAILTGNRDCFARLAQEIASVFLAERIELVAGDAVEGYNPTHDLCRLVIDAAVALVQRTAGTAPRNYDFPLTGRSDVCPDALRQRALWLSLDDAALKRKMTAAAGYAELQAEVEAAVETVGPDALRVECLRPVEPAAPYEFPDAPSYERHGERQVAAGHYDRVVRYREHVLPIAAALRALARDGHP